MTVNEEQVVLISVSFVIAGRFEFCLFFVMFFCACATGDGSDALTIPANQR